MTKTYETGASAVVAGITNWIGAWATATAYEIGDGVENDGSSYVCTVAHTSGASTEPGTGTDWEDDWDLLAAKGDPGSGATDNDAIHDNVDAEISAITAKSALVDGDIFLLYTAPYLIAHKRRKATLPCRHVSNKPSTAIITTSK